MVPLTPFCAISQLAYAVTVCVRGTIYLNVLTTLVYNAPLKLNNADILDTCFSGDDIQNRTTAFRKCQAQKLKVIMM